MSRDATQSEGPRSRPLARRWAGLCLVLLVTGDWCARGSSVVRSLPATFTPEVAFSVTNAAAPDSSVIVYAVEDIVPGDWGVTNVSDDGTFDAATSTVEWGPFFDSVPRELSYKVIPPADAALFATATFSGFGLFNLSEDAAITGDSTMVPAPSSLSAIVCVMPATFVPGVPFLVTNIVTAASNVNTYAVEDILPAGWTAANISDDGSFNSGVGAVQWGPFFDGLARSLSYTAEPPTNAISEVTFSGTGDFGGMDVAISGQRLLTPVLPSPGSAIRALQSNFTPGQLLTVTCLVTPASHVLAFAVQDQPPADWIVTNISADGSYDAENNLVQWGPFFADGATNLTYDVIPPEGAGGTHYFSGSATFDSSTVAIAGQSATVARPIFYGSVKSSFATNYSDGVPLTVSDEADPASNILAYAVEDTVPPGWLASNISYDGSFDPATGAVLWGPFFDALPRTLTYQVTPPVGAAGAVNFAGQATFDATTVAIVGQRQTTATPVFVGSVVSSLSTHYYAGVNILVTDLATPAGNALIYAVQDTLPSGWTATSINCDGSFDASGGVVQWGPFFDNQTRALSYLALPPALATGVAVFSGAATFDTSTVPITGQRQTTPATGPPPPPAVLFFHATLTNGQFQFDFTNTTGLPATVYATTNLALPRAEWETLGAPQSLGGGLYRFTDTNAANLPQRFFLLH